MGLRALLRNLTKLVLLGLGGVLGAIVVVWARANSDWATLRLPPMMVPGSNESVEYEARVYALVVLSFAAGLLASVWIALTIWVRAVRRERRLARALERLEAQVAETRGLRLGSAEPVPALPASQKADSEPHFEDFDDIEGDSEPGLISDVVRLPAGYDDLDDVEAVDEPSDEELRDVERDSRGWRESNGG